MHCSFASLPFTKRQHEISLDWRANWKSWVEFFNFCSTSLSTDIFIHPASHRLTTTESFSSLVVIVKRFASWKKESSSVLAPWELFSLSSLHSNVIFMLLALLCLLCFFLPRFLFLVQNNFSICLMSFISIHCLNNNIIIARAHTTHRRTAQKTTTTHRSYLPFAFSFIHLLSCHICFFAAMPPQKVNNT